MLALIQQYRLLLIGLVVAVLMALSAAGAWQWQANAYRARLAQQAALHSATLGELARASARQLQAQQERRQALETRLAALDTQHYQELTHAQQTTDRLTADLAAARQRLSVLIRHASGNGVPTGTGAAGLGDGVDRAELHPAVAAELAALAGDADRCAVKLTALQAWAREVVKGGG